MQIREADEGDAAAFLDLVLALDAETRFMMLEPGERTSSVEDVREKLRAAARTDNEVILLAEVDGALAGYVEAAGGRYRRNRHSATVVIGVRTEYSGRGIGARLLEELERWARAQGVRRLELTVMADNQRAIALYRRMGYEREGLRRDSLLVDGRFVDEYAMARILRDASV